MQHLSCEKDICDYGVSPDLGFDCSGFVTHLLNKIGFPVDSRIRHCREYFDEFGVPVHLEGRQRGDLVVFSRSGTRPTHIGILISEGEYIHAPGVNDSAVMISQLKIVSLPRKFKSQLYFTDPIGIKRLAITEGKWKKIL